MARFNFLGRAVDTYGNVKASVGITIRLTGTSTPATVYIARTGGTGVSVEPQITSDGYGRFNFYVDELDYPFLDNQKFDIIAGGLTYEDIEIMRGLKVHHSLEELGDDDHPQYASLAQNETITGDWVFSQPVTGQTPTKNDQLATKYYVDLNSTTNIESISAASDEADQRHLEWTNIQFTNERNTTNGQIAAESDVRSAQDALVSGASIEANNRHREWADVMFASTSAASREQDDRLWENAWSASASSLEQDARLTENILSVSAASLEQDARLTENIISVSAASREQDNRLWENVWSASASSLEQDARLTENILSVSASSKEQDNRLDENITLLENLHVDKAEPTGIVTRTGSSLSFSDGTSALSLTGTYDYYISGVKYSGNGAVSPSIDGTIGNHFFYLDSSGTINITKVFDVAVLLKDNAYIAALYWAGGKHIYLGDERHGITWDWNIHAYHHVLEGTKFQSGLGLSNIDADQNGSENAHAQLGVGQGIIWDEDLDHTITETACASFIPVFYRSGANGTWSYDIPSGVKATFPVKSFDNFDQSNVRIAWNEYTGGSWQQTEATTINYVLAHLFATNDTNRGIIAIQGQNQYLTAIAAREGANTEMLNLSIGTLPLEEILPIATVIYQTRTTYTNLINARIVKTDEGDDYIDFRQFKGTSTGGTNIDNHGNLAGLGGDDHLQYAMLNGLRDFTGTVGGIPAVEDTDFTQKLYVDAVSASSVEQDKREREVTNVQIISVSAASVEQDKREREATNVQIISVSAASVEQDNREREATNVQILSVSAASVESDRTLQSNIDNLTTDHGELTGLEDDDHSQYLLVNGTRSLTDNWNIGNYNLGIGIASPLYPIHIFENPGISNSYVMYLDIDPSGTLTGNATHKGIYVNLNSSVKRDGNSYYMKGADIGVFSSSDADVTQIIGLDLGAQHNVPSTLNDFYGLRFQGQFTNGHVNSAYGNYSNTTFSTGSSGTVYYGNSSNVSMNAAAPSILGTVYGYRSNISQYAGELTSGYLFAGFYTGTIGTKWGVYLDGEDKSYFSGNVGIGDISPDAKLDVNGDLILQNGTAIDEFSIDGTLAGNSDDAVPTEKAVKTYADAVSAASKEADRDFLFTDGSRNISGNLTQNDGLYIATDEIRAIDSGGLNLKDDSGTLGLALADGGNITLGGVLILPNNKAYYAKTVAGTSRYIAYMNTSDNVIFGDTNVSQSYYRSADQHLFQTWTGGVATKMLIGQALGIQLYDNVTITSLNSLTLGAVGVSAFSTDGTFIKDRDFAVPTEKAVKTYVDPNMIFESGLESLSVGASGCQITFSGAASSDTYTVIASLSNVISNRPSIYSHLIYNKTVNDFDVMFSGVMDSDNYVLEWMVKEA